MLLNIYSLEFWHKMEKNRIYLSIVIALLIIITLLTKFQGGSDFYDYADSAKYFAGEYDAKIRTSHSYLYGLIHAPFVSLMDNFLIFKITSLVFLLLIVYSVYWISGKNKKALWLMLLSPIVWYMGPWVSPIQLASLLFLWAWFYIKKSCEEKDLKKGIFYLIYSGILIGLSWAFWDAVLFFIPLLMISFFYDKKLSHSLYYILFILIGALPRLILDYILFGFPFFTTVRHIMASLALTFLGGFYEQGNLLGIINFVSLIIFFPVFIYILFKKKIFAENKKTAVFILLSAILLIINSQIRFVLLIIPIIILSINKYLSKKEAVIQIVISLIIILAVLNPYILQIKYDVGIGEEKGAEFESFFKYFNRISISNKFERDIIKEDINKIAQEYPNQAFVVGNNNDNYRVLANLYWGNNVREFVSIEDYKLNISQDEVAKKEFCTNVKIRERRDFCFSASIRKAFNDDTDYNSIKYVISFDDDLDIEGFKFVRKYEKLSVFQKV